MSRIIFKNSPLGITANKLNRAFNGTWTDVSASLGGGWTATIPIGYQIFGGLVFFKGMIQAAYSLLGTTAFTLITEACPSAERRCVLAGAQNTGTVGDVASYIIQVLPTGVCTIFFLGAGPFVWADPSKVQQIFLDGLSYSL